MDFVKAAINVLIKGKMYGGFHIPAIRRSRQDGKYAARYPKKPAIGKA